MRRPIEMPAVLRRSMVVLFWSGAALTTYFATIAIFDFPKGAVFHLRADHVMHMAAFTYLSIFGLLLWAPAAAVSGLLLLSGGTIEIVQMVISGRSASLSDFGASAMGVAIGAGFVGAVVAALARSGRISR